ncbi:MAG: S41 family peptidase [Bacteroidales bacterium]|jgi:carboxyl-terminal processing protease|nr:S41 family peptidase [Bacteroidales bacterium]
MNKNTKNNIYNFLLILFFVFLLLFSFYTGMRYVRLSSAAGFFFKPDSKVVQVMNLLHYAYVDSLSAQQLEDDAINGMLKKLDPHSQYIPPALLPAVNETINGNFSGIGIQFNILNDTVVVINTVPKGPSEKAGIMAGDRLIVVDRDTIAGKKYVNNDIIKRLKGETGSKVTVGMFRRDVPNLLYFDIIRDRIPISSVDAAYMLTPETGYIKVSAFSKSTLDEFRQALDQLRITGMTQLVVDLRNNSGGLIDPATQMAGLFLPKGTLVVYTEGKNSPRRNYYSEERDTSYLHTGLTVLINEYSASASEIFAGAIQDNDRGTIIGRRSYGKGLVQEQHDLRDGSAIRITVARYYTPIGRSIQKPYANIDEYYDDLNERYRHGELMQADSTHFNDSLMFRTPQGKIVYGGGGIMPEIFVPMDTSYFSEYYAKVMRHGWIYRFALEYTDKHRKELTDMPDYMALEKKLAHDHIMYPFTAYIAKQGLPQNNRDLAVSGAAIGNMLTASIVRNIFGEVGYYSILNKEDKMLQTAIETLKQNNSK